MIFNQKFKILIIEESKYENVLIDVFTAEIDGIWNLMLLKFDDAMPLWLVSQFIWTNDTDIW